MGAGKAKVKISFDDWPFGGVEPTAHELEVVAVPPGPKLEPGVSRMRATLIHPNKNGVLTGLCWTPDGRRLMASDSPGGVVQVWEADGGKQLFRIEPGPGYKIFNGSFCLSPDGKAIYSARTKTTRTRVEGGGKQLVRWEFADDVRVWDAETGELRGTFRHAEAHGVTEMKLSPDGATLLTAGVLAGETAGRPKDGASLWDVRAGRARRLAVGLDYFCAFSPDGKYLAAVPSGKEATVRVYDVASGKEQFSFPAGEQATYAGVWAFAPDGKAIIGYARVLPRNTDWSTYRDHLKVWDAATGKELATFPAAEGDGFTEPAFSPGGRICYCATYGAQSAGGARLLAFDTASWKQTGEAVLISKGKPAAGERLLVRAPTVSPDGRWAAVVSQGLPEDRGGGRLSPDSLGQPRIHLIELATNRCVRIIFAPPGLAVSARFSPDGKTLASSGSGRVYLWDLAKPPGGR